MRRIGIRVWAATAGAVLGVLVLPPVVGATSDDSLVGLGRLTVGTSTLSFNVNARSGPSGEGASGMIRIDRTGMHTLSGDADVICLRAEGNMATAVGRLHEPVPNPNEPGTTYQYVVLWVTDNGSPGRGNDVINSGVTWGASGAAPIPSCSSFVGGLPSEAGNLRISDSTP